MDITRNYTMEDPKHYNESNGYRLVHYRGNDFWVKYDYIAIDEDGAIFNFVVLPFPHNDGWIDRNDCGDMTCIGDVFGNVWDNGVEDWLSTLEKVKVK